VPRIEHKHRVAEYGSRDGAHEDLGLGVEICVGASGRSPRALVERRVRTPALALSDDGCETADVLRRFEGAIERTFGVAASPALGTLTISGKLFEPRRV